MAAITANTLAEDNANLKQQIARLAEENSRLMNARLSQERDRLMQENAQLQMASQAIAPPGWLAPPGLAPQLYAPHGGWLGVDSADCAQFSSSFASTCLTSSYAGSSLVGSFASADMCEDLTVDDKTTLMLQNVPSNYTRTHMLNLLDDHGFKGFYDLVYLPIDFGTNAGFGYAFVNFTSTEDAELCVSRLQGFKDWLIPSEKVLDVAWSSQRQGFDVHVERYRNSPVMHETVPDEMRPAIFVSGKRVPFPPPTKKLRPPRPHKRQ